MRLPRALGSPPSLPAAGAGALALAVLLLCAHGLYLRIAWERPLREENAQIQARSVREAEQEARMHVYRWVDRKRRVRGIPLEVAMEITLREAEREQKEREQAARPAE